MVDITEGGGDNGRWNGGIRSCCEKVSRLICSSFMKSLFEFSQYLLEVFVHYHSNEACATMRIIRSELNAGYNGWDVSDRGLIAVT